MTALKTNGPLINPGLCRCCSSIKKCRLMTAEYEWMGHKEVYSDMILDCFGLLLSNVDSEQDGCVCATCVVRLRDACNFRKQILQSEETFLKKLHNSKQVTEIKGLEMEIEVKDEPLDIASDNEPTPYDDDDSDPIYQPPANKMDISVPDEISTRKKKNVNVKRAKKVMRKGVELNGLEKNVTKSVLRKIEIMEMKLNKALQKPGLPKTKKTSIKSDKSSAPVKLINMDKDYMSEQNLITLVETSYVCPFKNRKNCFYCYYCNNIFARPDELREHTLTHDPKEFVHTIKYKQFTRIDVFRIDCRLCSERIDNLNDFKTHIADVHNKKFYLNVPDNFVQFRLTFKDPTCIVCNKSFSNFYFLYNHTIEHFSTFTCDVCGKCFLQERILIMHLKRHDEGSHTCETCGKVFKQKHYKDLHVNSVHKKKSTVYCPKCDDIFPSYASKNKHLIEHHGEPRKDFPCNICDKIYHRRKTLMEHIRRNHLNIKKHQCEYCEQKFYAPSRLKEHMTIHTGERNFQCEFCDKTYPRLKSLQLHLRTHTNDRRYKCNVCGQAFLQNTSLKTHTKSHHPELNMESYY